MGKKTYRPPSDYQRAVRQVKPVAALEEAPVPDLFKCPNCDEPDGLSLYGNGVWECKGCGYGERR
jgi:ribosomal protein L37AE/L43A